MEISRFELDLFVWSLIDRISSVVVKYSDKKENYYDFQF